MKKLFSILVICLSLLTSLTAQNIWKPIDMNGVFIGTTSDGSIITGRHIYGGPEIFIVERSQDDGATWQQILSFSDIQGVGNGFTINDEGRIIILGNEVTPYGSGTSTYHVFYSDDDGDTWQETEETVGIILAGGEIGGVCAPNDDIVVIWLTNGMMECTIDGGQTWENCWFYNGLIYDLEISDVIVNASGDIYASIYHPFLAYGVGIYYSYLFDIYNLYQDPELVAFEGIAVQNLEFDPEGNVVAGGGGEFQQQPGFYLVPDSRFVVADNGIIYDIHNVGENNNNYTVLRYSADHGETFYEYGEALQLYSPAPGGMGDGMLYKGRDGHLYFSGHGAFKKSIFNTNDIHYIEGEVVVLPDAFAFGNYPHGAGQAIRVDDDHIYPVTVDGFRPDPTDLSRLIVRYDTIPMGATIGAFGTIREMHDYVGDSQLVLDIWQTTAHYYDAITATLEENWENNKVMITNYQTYYITINGEKQEFPLVFNGDTLYWGCLPRTFIGHCSIQTDQYANQFYGMELVDIQPYMNYNYQIDGTLTTDFWDPPCLSCPCEEEENQHFLTVVPSSLVVPHYLMRNGQLYKDTFINNDVFREGMHVDIKGIRHFRWDIPGDEVKVVELVEMDTDEEAILTGTIVDAPMPQTGYIAVPGMELAFMANGRRYYLENEQDYDGGLWILVGNDTIYTGQEITATFTTKMMLDFNQHFYYRINITQAEPVYDNFPIGTEWYYEITNDNGSVTYQYLECAADTTINDHPIHILVRINTLYDKEKYDVTTHEYIYEENNKVYWWNKTLSEFTTLYDFGAEVGDEWEIKVGTQTIPVHVDAAQTVTYKSQEYKMLSISDPDDIFTGDIICGIGHLTSFFPEKLMNKGYRVENIRCFWQDGELVYQNGDQDCDEIYEQHHLGVEENEAENGFAVYPNPSHDVLFVLSESINSEYRITNIIGQTLMTGEIISDNQKIDVSSLSEGIYFITLTNKTTNYDVSTQKFVIK